MVLSSDLDSTRLQIPDRMVATMMAELQLERFSAQGEPRQLVPETDPENRHATDELSNVLLGVGHRLGISGSVR